MLLHEILTERAAQTPEANAIVAGRRLISYEQLDTLSSQIARLLSETGCRPGDRVGLLVPKSIEAIASMFGVLKAGAIYVPMDTKSPAARLAKVVDVCRPQCVLSARCGGLMEQVRSSTSERFNVGLLEEHSPDYSAPAFSIRDIEAAEPREIPVPGGGQIAHILFTSGSTGVPKGVMITHDNVVRFLEWAHKYFGQAPGDRCSGHPPLHFDLSTFDIYGTFFSGGELHLVPEEANLLPNRLAAFIRDSELQQWFSVPSALKFMAQFDAVQHGDFPSLKRLLWCGEALPTPTLMYWMKRLPHVQFTNLYGPTEATIASSYYTVPRCPQRDTDPIPIGLPCAGEDMEVLDEQLQSVPAGEVGDLFISGAGLSPGYWEDPERTESVFKTSPGGRRYKTGDLARVGPDGLFYLLGRSDSQIKSRGFRIELGEIEAALHTLDEIQECAVVALPSSDFDGTAICCAYASTSEKSIEPTALRERLSSLLPVYMLPSRWLRMQRLPLNGNGKIDRPRVRQHFEAMATAT